MKDKCKVHHRTAGSYRVTVLSEVIPVFTDLAGQLFMILSVALFGQ